jgi:hypothetical protein
VKGLSKHDFLISFHRYFFGGGISMRVRRMEKYHSAIVGAPLLLLTIVRVSAEVNQTEARRCSIIVDDEKRLGCFDDLSSTKPKARDSARDLGGWSVIGGKSTIDGSLQFSGALVAGDAALILRCREQKMEAAFSTQETHLGEKTVGVRYRFDQQEPVKELWRASMNCRAAFAPHQVDFIRALPDGGRVFIRITTADGDNKDANFLREQFAITQGCEPDFQNGSRTDLTTGLRNVS